MTTLLIVDDHGSFRAWARRVLADDGYEIVGEAADGASAIEAVIALQPEVTLLDILLPDMSGLDVADAIDESTTVVLTSSRSEADFGDEPRLAGRFVPKTDLSGDALARAAARS
ncbi:MAG: response regulator [Actinobacteria bacterium]|nr:response regulator [Actinomycetota bacterium]